MLEAFADHVWYFEHDMFLPGRVHFRGRSTVVRLEDGDLWVHSPNPIGDEIARELAELGPVRHLVAPNALHHLHLSAAAARYPDAEVWGAPGVAAKVPALSLTSELGPDAPEPWAGEIDQVFVAGAPWMSEVVFFHRASRTLVVTDLVFNVHGARGLSPLVFRMVGAWKRLAQSRLLRTQVKDRAAFAEGARQILAWDFEAVLMAHGEPVVGVDAEGRDAKERLRGALEWMLAG